MRESTAGSKVKKFKLLKIWYAYGHTPDYSGVDKAVT